MNELPVLSRKIPGRKNAPTTYELFLYVNPERQYIEPAGVPPVVGRIRGDASMLVSIDADVLYKLSVAFRKRLDEYEKKVAKYVEFQKVLSNKRKKTAVDLALLQYNVGDWCLLSSRGTLRERDKFALEWLGPVQITETISKNVYKIKAFDGKAMEVHGSRLYFYEPSGFVPSEALRKTYVRNFKHLKVAKFGDVKYDPQLAEYVIEVRWRGFRSEENTWESVQTMYEDVRNTLLEHLTKKTRRPSQDKMRKRAKQALIMADHAINRVIRRVPGFSAWRRHLDKVETRSLVEWKHFASARGWTKEEKQELRKLVLKFGVGRYDKYQLYSPHKTKAMMNYYIQQRLGRLDLEEIGGECWDIEKARKSSELISRVDFRCTRHFADCEQALALANEEVAKEFTPKYAEDLRRQRKKAADYVRKVADICKKLEQYPDFIRTMVLAFEEEKEAEWGVSWFRVRYERHAEPTRTPMVLTNHPQEIEQSTKWRYLMSFEGEVQFTMIQKTGRILDVDFEEDRISVRGCILPPEKMWYNIDPYSNEWRNGVQGLVMVDLLLADPSVNEHKEEVGSKRFKDFGITELQPRLVAIWISQQDLGCVFRFMEGAGYEIFHAWTWIKMTQRGKIKGSLGRLFQRSHEVLYFFRKCEALGDSEMKAIQEQKVIFADRIGEVMKPLVVQEWIECALGEGALLMEVFARTNGLRKGWLQLGEQVNPSGPRESHEI
eukprot:snap_masked-scaffold_28-processed-gene-0.21-mRNA-1 protein AED:0.99 eAED:0.99 QI:0/-1/0/1/-1/1/1/0/718